MKYKFTITTILDKYYPTLKELTASIATLCMKGDKITYNTSFADITFKIK